jgi:hypothetical protein
MASAAISRTQDIGLFSSPPGPMSEKKYGLTRLRLVKVRHHH